MKISIKILIFFFCFFTSPIFSEIYGHLKGYAIYRDANAIGKNNASLYTTLRLNYLQKQNDRYLFHVAYELADLITQRKTVGIFPFLTGSRISYRVQDFKIVPVDKKHFELYQNLDRFYISLSAPKTDITIGRQPIAFGIARIISPIDIIIPYPFFAIDQENRIGVDAIRTIISPSPLSQIDFGYIFGHDFSLTKSLAYFKTSFNVKKTDIGMIFAYFQESYMLGMNIQRPIWEAGFWFEAAYVFAGGGDLLFKAKDYFRLSTGIDYNLTSKIYAFVEYHYNGAGADSKNKYFSNVYQIAYTKGEVYLLGKHYIIPGVHAELTPLTNLDMALVFNFTDYSWDLDATVDYNIAQNLYLDFSALINVGKSRTEFDLYYNRFYVALRYYF